MRFTYQGAIEPELVARSGLTVEVVREHGRAERDPEVGPMFLVRFPDGLEASAFIEELDPAPVSATLELVAGEWCPIGGAR